MGDISERAREVLRAADIVFAEDTRHSGQLMRHFGLRSSLQSLHEHNENERIIQIEKHLREGGTAALVSDAGTPLVSDPGFRLVRHCQQVGLAVSPVPGASALIAALCVSGLPTDSFVFCGFPPARAAARQSWLRRHAAESRTLIFFESRHRVLESLQAMRQCFGDQRLATIARELTKTFETVKHDSLASLCAWIADSPEQQKGEFVIVVAGAPAPAEQIDENELKRVLGVLLANLPASQAASVAAEILGCKRKQAYNLALKLRGN